MTNPHNPPLPPASRWRHRVRGSEHDIIGTGSVQTATPIPEGARVIAYTDDHYGLCVRTIDEFLDGPFERVPASDAPGQLQTDRDALTDHFIRRLDAEIACANWHIANSKTALARMEAAEKRLSIEKEHQQRVREQRDAAIARAAAAEARVVALEEEETERNAMRDRIATLEEGIGPIADAFLNAPSYMRPSYDEDRVSDWLEGLTLGDLRRVAQLLKPKEPTP